jgi:hypothetical protein
MIISATGMGTVDHEVPPLSGGDSLNRDWTLIGDGKGGKS